MTDKKNYQSKLLLDASNGIGGTLMTNEFIDHLRDKLDIEIINSNDLSLLNEGCGAEYVHKD